MQRDNHVTNLNHSDTNWYDNTHIKSTEKKKCMICKKKTDRLDIFSEGYLCSEECDKAFYKIVASQEQCND